jgi:hypothetical protein
MSGYKAVSAKLKIAADLLGPDMIEILSKSIKQHLTEPTSDTCQQEQESDIDLKQYQADHSEEYKTNPAKKIVIIQESKHDSLKQIKENHQKGHKHDLPDHIAHKIAKKMRSASVISSISAKIGITPNKLIEILDKSGLEIEDVGKNPDNVEEKISDEQKNQEQNPILGPWTAKINQENERPNQIHIGA